MFVRSNIISMALSLLCSKRQQLYIKTIYKAAKTYPELMMYLNLNFSIAISFYLFIGWLKHWHFVEGHSEREDLPAKAVSMSEEGMYLPRDRMCLNNLKPFMVSKVSW